jgi:hypothetical protein
LGVVPEAPDKTQDEAQNLIYPKRLNANQRDLVDRYLTAIPADQRQPVLDELEGRIRSEKHGAKVVYDEARYLGCLCREVNAGRFQANLGIDVQQHRQLRRSELARRREQHEAAHRSQRQTRSRSGPELVKTHLAEIRKTLGVASAPDSE